MSLMDSMHKIRKGTLVIANKESPHSSAVIISDDGVKITDKNAVNGINIGDHGITIQGDLLITGKGTSIKKGEYSENPNSAKIFTYTETISPEASIKGVLAEAAGKLGINTGELTRDGIVPLLTDISGYPPHLHTMLFKHVHRTEPSYLYRIPGIVKMFTGAMQKLNDFFKLFGS